MKIISFEINKEGSMKQFISAVIMAVSLTGFALPKQQSLVATMQDETNSKKIAITKLNVPNGESAPDLITVNVVSPIHAHLKREYKITKTETDNCGNIIYSAELNAAAFNPDYVYSLALEDFRNGICFAPKKASWKLYLKTENLRTGQVVEESYYGNPEPFYRGPEVCETSGSKYAVVVQENGKKALILIDGIETKFGKLDCKENVTMRGYVAPLFCTPSHAADSGYTAEFYEGAKPSVKIREISFFGTKLVAELPCTENN